MQLVNLSKISYTELQPTKRSTDRLDFCIFSKQSASPPRSFINNALPAIGDGQGNASGSLWHPLYSLRL